VDVHGDRVARPAQRVNRSGRAGLALAALRVYWL